MTSIWDHSEKVRSPERPDDGILWDGAHIIQYSTKPIVSKQGQEGQTRKCWISWNQTLPHPAHRSKFGCPAVELLGRMISTHCKQILYTYVPTSEMIIRGLPSHQWPKRGRDRGPPNLTIIKPSSLMDSIHTHKPAHLHPDFELCKAWDCRVFRLWDLVWVLIRARLKIQVDGRMVHAPKRERRTISLFLSFLDWSL